MSLVRSGFLLLVAVSYGSGAGPLGAQATSRPALIAAATLPLPPELRLGATVVALSAGGIPDTVQAGTNVMVCFADTPADTLFDVRCYHRSFVPMIYESRRLRQSGLSSAEVEARLAAEVQSGALQPPPGPTAGYRVLGPIRGYHPGSGELGPELDRWQSLHMPFATAADVGASEEQRGTEPFMMASGTWWAHVMIMQQPLRY